MKPFVDAWTIIIVGKWNIRIFTPDWIGNNLLEKKDGDTIEIEMEVSPDFNAKIIDSDVIIAPTSNKLTIGVKNINKDTLQRAQDVALKIVQLLCHTPISAVGINFGFVFEELPDSLVDALKISDSLKFPEYGYEVQKTAIRRTLIKDDKTINLKISSVGKMNLDFNFHTKTSNGNEVQQAIRDGFIVNMSIVDDICGNVYGLTFEWEAMQ